MPMYPHPAKALKPPAKIGVLSSYGWGKGALSHASDLLGPTALEVVGALEINGLPSTDDYKAVEKISKTLAEKILEA
jgi:flavorubredoxin